MILLFDFCENISECHVSHTRSEKSHTERHVSHTRSEKPHTECHEIISECYVEQRACSLLLLTAYNILIL